MIGHADSRYASIDRAAFASKNVYNAALYVMRQAYILQGERLDYKELYHRMQSHEAYRALPAKVAQQVLKLLEKNWKAYFEACEAYRADPSKFLGHPNARFIDMLCYKATLVGIQVVLTEESYTSKASFLDLDPLPTYGQVKQEPAFSGTRPKRGIYKASSGKRFNADVNGSYNILRKASPDAFTRKG